MYTSLMCTRFLLRRTNFSSFGQYPVTPHVPTFSHTNRLTQRQVIEERLSGIETMLKL